ncbi:alpha/beta hydrolase [Shinella sp. CPCC 100929]|uniref:Alpha/beta hydrolase n=1 Tax=Shinella lacus TaxID=2654216 RepID=A0ABT1R5L3_9HYPH|nr:prolyl oligopeptidase family serine peptidase [Shinella lacus]MCQ4630473.1 alpha/beta hydrolase [Shinella lacus]
MSDVPKYFMYFPGNYRWSSAFINMLGRTPYGGTDISELHKVGRQLQGKRADDDEAWFNAFIPVADEVRQRGEAFEASGHPVSAAAFYLRACHYYQMGERFRTPKDQRALDAYRTGVECFHKFAKLGDYNIEIVEVPFEGGNLPGYFVPAQNAKSERTPCVVFFDGLDVTKEIQFVLGVPDLIKRGISVLVMDGPGTGEAIRFRGLHLRHDYEAAGGACIDYLETREDVDSKKIGVVAISLGGYYAPRCAAMEPRFAACVAWGAIWDYHAVWKRRIEASFNASMSVPGHHITWILGVDTLEEALEKLEPFRLDGVVQNMKCPFLVTHGADDEQVPLKDAQALFDAIGSADKTIRVFDGEEGGAQHCQRDYLTYGTATMWSWFEDKLVHGR